MPRDYAGHPTGLHIKVQKSFDLNAVSCYHETGDSMNSAVSELYNPEVKEQFLSTIENEGGDVKKVLGHLKKFTPAEKERGMDIAQMDIDDAIEVTQNLGIRSTSTLTNTLVSIRKYVNWCIKEEAIPNCGNGFSDINSADVAYSKPSIFFLNEDDLLRSLSLVRDLDNGEPEVPCIIFSWLGIDRKIFQDIKDSQVDLDRRIIYGEGGRVLVSDFSSKIRDALLRYRNCMVSVKYYGGRPSYSHKDLSVDTFLKHFFTEKVLKEGSDEDIGKPFTRPAIVGALGRLSADYTERFGTKKMTAKNAEVSGRLSKLLIADIDLGSDITSEANRKEFDSIAGCKSKKKRSDFISMYRKYRDARLKSL